MADGAEERSEGVVIGAKGVRAKQGAKHGDRGRGEGGAGERGYHGVVEHGVPAGERDGVEEGGGIGEAAGDGVGGDKGRCGDGAGVRAEEDRRGGEVGGEGVEVEEAEREVGVGRVVEKRGGEEARVEAAEGAEEGAGRGRDRGVARGKLAEEDGALVGEGGDGVQRRRHRSSALLGGFGARAAAHGSNGDVPRPTGSCLGFRRSEL